MAQTFAIVACGGAPAGVTPRTATEAAEQKYEQGVAKFRDGDCENAEVIFREVRREYSYSRFAALSELRIADCHMKMDRHVEAIAAYRQFIRSRPSHVEVPYARFKIAEAYFKQIPEDNILTPPAYERDQGPTRDALAQLRRFILDFPDDPRVVEAGRMARQVSELLANTELYAARYYLARDYYQGALWRLETIMRAYPGTPAEVEAMRLLVETYRRGGQPEHAAAMESELHQRFPTASPENRAN